jgi:hypothetical protein
MAASPFSGAAFPKGLAASAGSYRGTTFGKVVDVKPLGSSQGLHCSNVLQPFRIMDTPMTKSSSNGNALRM